ncbi:uncharacterized protein JCM15063_006082 [Sporobolomyces koalae]|uniref:uncharacterized protein n=1 Tax=Sporobolomyces koalae TaxID=500713 RepID=UPI003179F015
MPPGSWSLLTTENPRYRRAISKQKNGIRRIKEFRNYRLRFGLIDSSPAALDAAKTTRVNYIASFDGCAEVPDLDDLPNTDGPRISGFFDAYPSAFLHFTEN